MWFFLYDWAIYIHILLFKMCRFYPKKVLIMQHIRDLLAGREKKSKKIKFS